MHDKHSQTPELEQLAAQLSALTPRTEFDRDKLMFAAGRRAGRQKLVAVNRLLGACCVLLAVAAILPLAIRPAEEIARDLPHDAKQELRSKSPAQATELPNQLAVADGRELAVAVAEGRSDVRPARLRETAQELSDAVHVRGPASRGGAMTYDSKPSRALLREYLEPAGKRM